MAALPQALPLVREDPAIEAGYAAKQTYTAREREIRDNLDLSELARAEQLSTAYDRLVTELDRLRTDLHGRRTARLARLERVIPTGAGVPADTPPADRAVILASFRTELERARDAGSEQARKTLLVDAERYDDDMQRRGTLTAALELGELDTVAQWVRDHTTFRDRDGFLEEMRTLRGQLAGEIFLDRQWELQALGDPQRPREMAELLALRAQRDAELAERRRTARYR